MNIYKHKSTILLLAVLALLGLTPVVHAEDTNKLKEDAQAAWDKTKDTAQDAYEKGKDLAKQGAEKAAEVGTNVAAKVKEGAKKASDAATNAAEKAKEKVHDMTK